ncbi:MAG: toxin-antitoxin system HicB family antitoxin [Gammaproteobacteria bacterium]|nr:toxin-antitoxin system HicB family antitoxin [Aestuariivita sp.]MCY4200631.1 toxin-antitoxin system HicB family antitoxin [Gammaproteobacteria bacterium]MCY4278697.1 toxin-antitoxin system HicB family antitoxin [Gammaproteobacteria bacterium]
MSTLSLRLPDSIHNQIRVLAKKEGVSMNQLLASAAAEKVAALLTEDYLKERARRASGKKFRAVLARVPRSAPLAEDEL